MIKRRLILCLDGTWNSNDKSDAITNVVKLMRLIPCIGADGISQIVYYDRGVGTGPGDRITGGFSGKGLDEKIIDAYRFLGNNYHPGDEIYLFGFSRGAYTARSLAGLIDIAGVIHPSCLGEQLDELQTIRRSNQTAQHKRAAIAAISGLRRHEPAPIKCIGVWDTVGSLGIPGDWARHKSFASRWYFHDVHLGQHVDVALHALAIDEKRPAFPPTLWEKPIDQPLPPGQVVEQVWFPGVHSNIGGSYADSRLSDITLDWMIKRLRAHTRLTVDDLTLHPAAQTIEDCIAGKGIESRTLLYRAMLSHAWPYLRTLCNVLTPPTGRLDALIRNRVKPLHSRRNQPRPGEQTVNERVHISALQRWQLEAVQHDAPEHKAIPPVPYRPPNLAEVIRQARLAPGKRPVTIVGWDGEPIPAAQVYWPAEE
ncbi:DUF2235 domain-containing protein [Halopseudomonas nanhaiensis]|uniref:DUF2235 domain-containing protein n=1 Tax=Halopseudomonas nanhaiensis TaxID=2830842 RepID=UPI001CBAF630|nr:DUF2235 domain-containing protein [Halopseudomonas nanhaiensis]UAW99454.1 DUF2235 domain-containing protein [Halopseudomonas nanhaiensis]